MGPVQDTEVYLDYPLCRLHVPYDNLVVLLEAHDDFGAIHGPVDARDGAL